MGKHWLNDYALEALNEFSEVVEMLFSIKASGEIDPIWYRIFDFTGHILSWVSHPEFHELVPTVGIFTVNNNDDKHRDRYNAKNDCLMFVHLADLASRLGSAEEAEFWANRAFDTARAADDIGVMQLVSISCSQYPLINRKFETAFEQYLTNGLLAAYFTRRGVDRYNSLTKVSFNEIQDDKPSEYWSTAEDTIIAFCLIPMVLQVNTAALENDHDYDKIKQSLINLVTDYLPIASDKVRWEKIVEILQKSFSDSCDIDALVNIANSYSTIEEEKHLQLLVLAGTFIKIKDDERSIVQLMNIVPYIQRTIDKQAAVIKYVLVPFVRSVCANYARKQAMSERLSLLLSKLEMVNHTDPNALQHLMQIVVNEFQIAVQDSRRDWLFNYINPN